MKHHAPAIHFIAALLFLALAAGCGKLPVGGDSGPAAHANWRTDFAAAQAQARAENKLLLLDFTGSDWCPPCMMMKSEVLDTAAFKEYADQHLVLVEVDFPRKKSLPAALQQQNDELGLRFQVEGLPTFIALDPQGRKVVELVGYQSGGPQAFIAQLKKAAPAPRPAAPSAAEIPAAPPATVAPAAPPTPSSPTPPAASVSAAPAATPPTPAPSGGGLVQVSGWVVNQAVLTIPRDGLRLTTAIARAGGPKPGAARFFTIVRNGGAETITVDWQAAQQDPANDPQLQGGDKIIVSSAAPSTATASAAR